MDHVGSIGTYVELQERGKGVGSRLFEATLAEAKRKQFQKLFTLVRADNPDALQAYIKQGFEVVGTARAHAKIDGRFIDETIIEKIL